MWTRSNCHSADRTNYAAQLECGVGGTGNDDDTNIWTKASSTSYNLTYWPFIQSTATYNCLNDVMQLSQKSLTTSFAKGAVVNSLITIGIIFGITQFA
jgi:hypothetical protein